MNAMNSLIMNEITGNESYEQFDMYSKSIK